MGKYGASMEPCLFRHGKVPVRDRPGVTCGASMEPCLFRHGKQRPPPEAMVHPTQASMEPCLFRHGKDDYSDGNNRYWIELQWSHVFSDMVR